MALYGKCHEGKIHLIDPINIEFTLCGDAFEEIPDKENTGPYWVFCKKRPITCDNCSTIIDACKKVK